jgi:hypothetical protein
MDHTPQELTDRLINLLTVRLAEQEDTESAITVYKMANWIISRLEAVKQSAINLAEQDMRMNRRKSVRTPEGSAGWTHPRVSQLNESAWQEALDRDPNLRRIHENYEQAESLLRQAQEPYVELPEPSFFIR